MNAFPRLVVIAALALGGCSATGNTPQSAPATSPSIPSPFGGTDLAWIEINIAMDEQLLPLLDLPPKRTTDPSTLALTTQVKAFTQAELGLLKQLHTRAGLPDENPHEGMPMPGMVTPEQVAEASQLAGPAFDETVTKHIKAHLEQSRNLARSEEKSGTEPQTRQLALQILRTREVALSTIETAN
ncbi:DUF305 domain-containing protein [Paractinoplanes deccanensis]|uniref:DUF305 domain-containing protein n=1 Tax=Paractinoplanes deccanensis TaxID=113561 RepID=A0ABQ3Y7L4_9ACTN|nr:DUF305 domain-containing protein [Actinoplanes deccanensis]GID75940.1 DUF305 domain-containing protein [Actinoplanes deccanensis]